MRRFQSCAFDIIPQTPMTFKLLQLNMWHGRYLNQVIDYIKSHDYDIIHLQEVSSGSASHEGTDNFEQILKRTSYKGKLSYSVRLKNSRHSGFGNATLIKPQLQFIQTQVTWMKEYFEPEKLEESVFANLPRNALINTIKKDGTTLTTINTHLAWGITPLDEPYKVEQGKILFDHIKTLTAPYIITGDFNVTPHSEILKMMNTLGRNLTIENNITNTLNPRTHRATHLFPKGLAVDYIITTPDIQVHSFEIIKDDLSDHLGLATEIEI